MEPTPRRPSDLRALVARFARFGVVGGTGVLVNLGLLVVFVEWFHLSYTVASVIAIEFSILTNYVLNHFWTWRGGDHGVHTFLNYQAVSLIGMAIQWAVLTAGVRYFGIHYLIGAAAGIGVATVWNFAANHWFTFAARSHRSTQRQRTAWMYVAAIVLQVALAAFFIHSWDGFVFKRTVENFLDHGESPYQTAETDPSYVYANSQVPAFAQWYAYPPLAFLLQSLTYGPYYLLGGGNQMVARVLLKVPILVAAIVGPYLARRFARDTGARPESAARLEKMLLFNPILLVISAAWGQTEVLVGVLVLASLWALHRERDLVSGILFGLACTVKIFPGFVYPLVLAYLWARRGGIATLRHVAASGLTIAAICLPFAVPHPQGFFHLVIGMHFGRPAGGFSLWAIPEWIVETLAGPSASRAVGSALSVLTLLAYFLFLASQSLRSVRLDTTTAALAHRLSLVFLGFLLISKVLHEQYIGLGVWILCIGAFVGLVPHERMIRATRRFAWAATGAALVRGLQFIMLIPSDEARPLFGATAVELIERFRQWLGVSAGAMDFVTQAAGSVLLVWAALGFVPLWSSIRDSLGDLNRWLHRIPHPVPHWTSRKAYTSVIAAALILVPSAAVGFLFPGSATAAHFTPAPLGNQVVGAYYEVWWRNPTNDPFQRDGNWDYATTTPAVGYYSSRTGVFHDAIIQMRSAGVDYALVPLNTRDTSAVRAFVYEAEQQGFRFSFLYDLHWTDGAVGRLGPMEGATTAPLPLEKHTFDDIRRYLERTQALLSSQHLLNIDDHPTVFIQGFDAVQYTGTLSEDRELGEHIADRFDADYLTGLVGNDYWQDSPELLAPSRNAAGPHQAALSTLWANAQRETKCDDWHDALSSFTHHWRNLTFVVDGSWDASTCFPAELVGGAFGSGARGVVNGTLPIPGAVRVSTIAPSYNATLLRPHDTVLSAREGGELAYAKQWSTHEMDRFILIDGWNDHQDGAAIEPTLEYGTLFLDATTRWTALGEAALKPATAG